jgi:flagellin-specific chaperone FliS
VVIDADRPSSEPLARLVRAYDRAIRACEACDHQGAREAINVLRCALDLESSASRSFDALYAWCEQSVDGHDFVGAAHCLRTLRDAWRQATQADNRRPIPVRRALPVC